MIFDRKKYKSFALKQLEGRWLVPVLISITILIILNIFQIPDYLTFLSTDAGMSLAKGNYSSPQEFMLLFDEATKSRTSLLIELIQILVEVILDVAALGVYLKMSRSPEPVYFSEFIENLNNWLKAGLAFLWQLIWVFLWSLLFIIPGIVKAIAYSQMYYLICEYENLSISKAMKISILITKGHKTEIFLTFLSFIGWFILVALTGGIGLIWLKPYMSLTFVNVYHALMKEALEIGIIRPEDLQ